MSDTESVAAFAAALADALGRTANRHEAPRSVILYGSRARGDCRPDSDWDVLAVWADRAERRFAALAFHADAPVTWVNKTRAEVEAQSQQGGSLVRSTLAWGRLVWGEPVRVEDWKETRDMNAGQWAGNWRRCVAKGRDATAEALRVDRWNLPPDDYDGALRQTSSDFAEAVAKMVLDARGIPRNKVHDVGSLARQLPVGDPFRNRTAALNDGTRSGPVAHYENDELPPDGETLARSLERFWRTLALLADLLDDGTLPDTIERQDVEQRVRDRRSLLLQDAHERWQVEVVEPLAASRVGRDGAGECAGRISAAAARISRVALERTVPTGGK